MKNTSNKNQNFNLIWITGFDEKKKRYDLMIPKNLMGMSFDKALGSLKWTKQSLGSKYPCFIYDPEKLSIFNEDGSQRIGLIKRLIK
jgi:hypothetical protein